MLKVRTLIPHASSVGLGTWRVGDVYEDGPTVARQNVAFGFVEFVDPSPQVETKEDRGMYRSHQISVRPDTDEVRTIPVGGDELSIESRSGNWYHFSDGEKVLGKTAAAERLGVSLEEFDSVDIDDG